MTCLINFYSRIIWTSLSRPWGNTHTWIEIYRYCNRSPVLADNKYFSFFFIDISDVDAVPRRKTLSESRFLFHLAPPLATILISDYFLFLYDYWCSTVRISKFVTDHTGGATPPEPVLRIATMLADRRYTGKGYRNGLGSFHLDNNMRICIKSASVSSLLVWTNRGLFLMSGWWL